jgi:hypothetical protein
MFGNNLQHAVSAFYLPVTSIAGSTFYKIIPIITVLLHINYLFIGIALAFLSKKKIHYSIGA